jgi:hypothetical protein
MVMSPDDSTLITSAHDGSMLVLHNTAMQLTPVAAQTESPILPSLANEPSTEAADITSAEALTLEEAVQEAQAQQLAVAAQSAKQQRLQQLKGLRAQLARLIAANRELPEGQRLPESAFHVDPGMAEVRVVEPLRLIFSAKPCSHVANANSCRKVIAFGLQTLGS